MGNCWCLKVWRKWTETKHLYRNIYIPYFIKESGDMDDDAILKCCKQHWLFKKNKNIKAHNNRMARLHRPASEYRAEVTVDLAPDNLNQAGELYPEEAISYLIFKEHPMFIRDATPTPTNDPTNRRPPDNDDSQPSAEDIEDTTLKNRMAAKGYFKSSNTLQAAEKDRKKRR
jgi:hypothetical protein